ncbi:MAG: polysaccharide pyruvyl transferase family protein [Bacteroidales bacterium]|nr:polysaccharide pyruvyl transferase family protein [Bacteroidales bacterium]
MRIALLNLPYDNNYGGNLQRYALMRMLQDMGHNVTHLNLRFDFNIAWYLKPIEYSKRFIIKYLLGKDIQIKAEKTARAKYIKNCSITDTFYNRYITHTPVIKSKKELIKYNDYEAFIVGSDQVWRKQIAAKNLPRYFFDYLKKSNKLRVAYAVSFGTAENELSSMEIKQYGLLYKNFKAVSVRELSAIDLLRKYNWSQPNPVHLLDPTFLLTPEHYKEIIISGNTNACNGDLFCYILDRTQETDKIIQEVALEKNLKPYFIYLNDPVSIPQWLRSFDEAKYVITDSFHGLVFSIIYNKPYRLIRNSFRGNARFDSIMQTFNLSDECNEEMKWDYVNETIKQYTSKASSFIAEALKE